MEQHSRYSSITQSRELESLACFSMCIYGGKLWAWVFVCYINNLCLLYSLLYCIRNFLEALLFVSNRVELSAYSHICMPEIIGLNCSCFSARSSESGYLYGSVQNLITVLRPASFLRSSTLTYVVSIMWYGYHGDVNDSILNLQPPTVIKYMSHLVMNIACTSNFPFCALTSIYTLFTVFADPYLLLVSN